MSDPDSVLQEIERKKKEKIGAIQRAAATEAAQLKRQAEERLDEELRQLRQTLERRLAGECEQRLRKLREKIRQRHWREECRLMKALLEQVRQALQEAPPPPDYIRRWLAAAKLQLSEHGPLQLTMRPDWCRAAAGEVAKDIELCPQDMLGGCILLDRASGRRVDGSWERRLQDMHDAIWQRWKRHVGDDH